MNLINTILDIEKDLRECDRLLSCGLRHLNCVRDRYYFDLMEELGFIVNNKFLPINDIFNIVSKYGATARVYMLESAACDLSLVYAARSGL